MGVPCEHVFAVHRDLDVVAGCKTFQSLVGHLLASRWQPDPSPAEEAKRYQQSVEIFRSSRVVSAPDEATATRLYVIQEYVALQGAASRLCCRGRYVCCSGDIFVAPFSLCKRPSVCTRGS